MAIDGTITYCPNPISGPLAGVTLNLTGDTNLSTLSDGSGNYLFPAVPTGGSYTITPTKPALPPTALGITNVDVIATQRHFLGVTIIPPGCKLAAADVTGDGNVTAADIIALQRFYLGITIGTANAGKYQFTPASRTYPTISTDLSTQDYQALVFGDVAAPFVSRPDGESLDAATAEGASNEIPSTVAALTLPTTHFDPTVTNLFIQVSTTAIDRREQLIGFQGDLAFDERVVSFQDDPIQKAGLTGGNWNVTGNVLDGPGPIRTLRISAFSNDQEPLSGAGTLFELKVRPTENGARSTSLIWATSPNNFLFIDASLHVQHPAVSTSGSITSSR